MHLHGDVNISIHFHNEDKKQGYLNESFKLLLVLDQKS